MRLPSKTSGVALGLVLSAIVLVCAMGDGDRSQTGPTHSAETNSVSAAAVPAQSILPVVPRSAAKQPPVGLAEDTHLDRTPPRQTIGLDLVRNGWTYNCMECHKLLPARWHYQGVQSKTPITQPVPVLNEHKNIVLEHGNNRFCLNCHHPTNRNAFVDYDGAEIPQEDVVQLCAKCHGTIYRDWKAGVHGRQNGHWNVSLGQRTKLRCIQCHDPHHPAFKSMPPLPPLRYPARGANPPATAHAETQSAPHH